MTLSAIERNTGRSLISAKLFGRLVSRIVIEDKCERFLAEQIVDQTLAFLSTCAANTGVPLVPSRPVDIGWHTFVLHTREYAEFCDQIAGRFLHHVPTGPGDSLSETGPIAVRRTSTMIEAAGFVVDTELWHDSVPGSCTGCANGCHDDPPPATEPH